MVRTAVILGLVAGLGAAPAASFERPRKEPAAKDRPCPEAGAGYVRVPGSDTCIRVGGSVRVEAATVKGGR